MKRSPINPKPHPDNPFSSFAPRKKGINRVSKAKRKEKAETDPARKKFAASVWLCQACCKREGKSVHEIACGGSRTQSLKHPACWLLLCEDDPATGRVGCHRIIQGWPRRVSMLWQLAIKKDRDLERYDRSIVLKAKGVNEQCWTEIEVDNAVRQLRLHGIDSWLNY